MTMYAQPGNRIVIRSQHAGGATRDGEVIGVEHTDGSPPYRVRWSDNGHESLFFPGPDATIDLGHPDDRLEHEPEHLSDPLGV